MITDVFMKKFVNRINIVYLKIFDSIFGSILPPPPPPPPPPA